MMLERMLRLAGDATTVILVSDHGYLHDARRPTSTDADPTEWHRNFGIACAAGPGIRSGKRLFGATVLDVTPTVLALHGLPAARDMDGRPWAEVLEVAPPAPIESWESVAGDDGRLTSPPVTNLTAELEAMKQLADLGYIESPTSDAATTAEQAKDAQRFNLAAALLDARSAGEAADVLESLRAERFPDSAGLALQIALARAHAGHRTEARRRAEELLSSDPSLWRAHLLLGVLNLLDGQSAPAIEHLRRVEEASPAQPAVWARLGHAYRESALHDDARRAFERALSLDPECAVALDGLAELCLLSGKNEEALQSALAATDAAFYFPRAHFHVAEALDRLGRVDDAVGAARMMLSLAPAYGPGHELLARLYERQGRSDLALMHRVQSRQLLAELAAREARLSK
jgi:tetratricopeptide (TPR) repeat protein